MDSDFLPAATEALHRFYPGAAAIIFYGACLRNRDPEGLLDFYVLVDRYRDAIGPAAALGARLLPPNVYRHTLAEGLEAKVAVIRVDAFLEGLGPLRFTPDLSARFAQPSLIVFARDAALRTRLAAGFLTAAETCIVRTLPLMPQRFTAAELWRRVLSESFATELRPERRARIDSLTAADPAFYDALTRRVLGDPADGVFRHDTPVRDSARAARLWRARRIAGKALNALRLIKAAFTFRGGLDYVAGKIERHTGAGILGLFTRGPRQRAIR